MDVWDVLLAVYLVVLVPALTLTWREQIRNGHRVLAYRAAGLLVCAVWPLVFPMIALAARRQAPRAR